MEGVRARFADGVHDPAGGPSVFGRKAAGQDRKLLNGVHTEYHADYVSGGGIRVIHHADAINAVVIECRPAARNGVLASEATVAARGGVVTHLGLDLVHAGLKRGQLGPVPPVQGQFAHRLGLHFAAER